MALSTRPQSTQLPWPHRPNSVPSILIEASIVLAAYFLIRLYAFPAVQLHKTAIASFWHNAVVFPLFWIKELLTLFKIDDQGRYSSNMTPGWSNPAHAQIGRVGYRIQSQILGISDGHLSAFFGKDPIMHANDGVFVAVGCYGTALAAWFIFGLLFREAKSRQKTPPPLGPVADAALKLLFSESLDNEDQERY